jgi:hypothetical protein
MNKEEYKNRIIKSKEYEERIFAITLLNSELQKTIYEQQERINEIIKKMRR